MPNKGYSWKQHAYNLSDGTPMIQFCRENDVCYCTVLKYIRKLGNVDEACAIAMKHRMKKIIMLDIILKENLYVHTVGKKASVIIKCGGE